jgi:hypothetical protein
MSSAGYLEQRQQEHRELLDKCAWKSGAPPDDWVRVPLQVQVAYRQQMLDLVRATFDKEKR